MRPEFRQRSRQPGAFGSFVPLELKVVVWTQALSLGEVKRQRGEQKSSSSAFLKPVICDINAPKWVITLYG